MLAFAALNFKDLPPFLRAAADETSKKGFLKMPIQSIHLKKLLKLYALSEKKLISELRKDVRETLKIQQGIKSEGGDFHLPFWSDCKNHLSGNLDLRDQTLIRVKANRNRKRLYPQLSKSFLDWWNEKKRWSNEGFSIAPETVKGRYSVPDTNSIVKVENILPLKIGDQPTRYFYPYFSEDPSLNEQTARMGLWLMQQALPSIPVAQLRILDVLRFKSYSLKKAPFQGNEEKLVIQQYQQMLKKWDDIYEELTG